MKNINGKIIFLSFIIITIFLLGGLSTVHAQDSTEISEHDMNFFIGILMTLILIVLSLAFIIIKRKTFEIITLHLVVMIFSIILGVLTIIPINSNLGIFVILFSVVAFIANVMMVET